MEYQKGKARDQLTLYTNCLDDMVPEDNSGRLIDRYVGLLDIKELGFEQIKRQWGFDHIITKKGIEEASSEFGMIALAYNLKRIFNLMAEKNNPFKALISCFSADLFTIPAFLKLLEVQKPDFLYFIKNKTEFSVSKNSCTFIGLIWWF